MTMKYVLPLILNFCACPPLLLFLCWAIRPLKRARGGRSDGLANVSNFVTQLSRAVDVAATIVTSLIDTNRFNLCNTIEVTYKLLPPPPKAHIA